MKLCSCLSDPLVMSMLACIKSNSFQWVYATRLIVLYAFSSDLLHRPSKKLSPARQL